MSKDQVRARLLLMAVQVAGLCGTACIVWMVSVAPRLRYQAPEWIVWDAFKYALAAFVWSGLLVFLMSLASQRSKAVSALTLALRTARTGVWLAPASILLSQLSPAAIVPALALVVGATQALYSQWLDMDPRPATQPVAAGMFQLLPAPSFIRALGPALTAAFGLQAGLVSATMGFPLAAAFLFSATTAMVTVLLLAAGLLPGQRKENLPRSILCIVLTVILAAGLTTLHGIYRYRHGAGGLSTGDPDAGIRRGPLDSAREMMRKLTEPDPGGDDDAPLDKTTKLYDGPATAVEIGDNVFPGVVLWPEAQPIATIVAPLPSWTAASLKAVAAGPYSIPFSGEYWMFKPPQSRPPRGAVLQHGTPLKMFYRTTDRRHMAMEAHQRLDHPIQAACCRAIQVAVRNADTYPGTVSFELLLIDNRAKPPVSLSLGKLLLTAYPRSGTAVSEILEFRVPGSVPRQFNELKVVMHRDPVRADKSARVSIDRFILVPRGV